MGPFFPATAFGPAAIFPLAACGIFSVGIPGGKEREWEGGKVHSWILVV